MQADFFWIPLTLCYSSLGTSCSQCRARSSTFNNLGLSIQEGCKSENEEHQTHPSKGCSVRMFLLCCVPFLIKELIWPKPSVVFQSTLKEPIFSGHDTPHSLQLPRSWLSNLNSLLPEKRKDKQFSKRLSSGMSGCSEICQEVSTEKKKWKQNKQFLGNKFRNKNKNAKTRKCAAVW